MADIIKAMISSTSLDLPDHRRKVLDACLQQYVFPRMMEHLSADDADAVKVSLGMVKDADVYIGIFAHRYGYVPDQNNPRKISITEMEYNYARKRRIPCLIFVMDDAHEIEIKDIEPNDAFRKKLEKLIERVKRNHTVNFYTSPENLKGCVTNSLSTLDRAHLGRRGPKSGSDGRKLMKPIASTESGRLMRIFVVSQDDVHLERSMMPRTIESLNKNLGNGGTVVELWPNPKNALPASGAPKALLDPEIAQVDVIVGIFWNHLGISAAEEERILDLIKKWNKKSVPKVIIYFCQRATVLETSEALFEKINVVRFRDKLKSIIGIATYNEAHDFGNDVTDDLFPILSNFLKRN